METISLWDGRSIPRIGVGCWAIGGPFEMDGRPDGWGNVDDAESERALRLAFDLGARLFDTADAYGTGHSEEVLGRAFSGNADVAIATKFGFTHDRSHRRLLGTDVTPDYAREACAASLRRLGRERIDLLQIHVGDIGDGPADALGSALEALAEAGDIAAWGWSTDDARAASRMLKFPHFKSVQEQLTPFRQVPEMVTLAENHSLANLIRSPLAMGFLTGKFTAASRLPADDVRAAGHSWVRDFRDGRPTPDALRRLDAIRDLLTTGGRTPAQGALGWILARSKRALPIPDFKTEAQVRENLGTLEMGPLPAAVVSDIAAAVAAMEVRA